MDAATAQQIRETFYVGVGFGLLLIAYFYLSHRSEDYGPTRWELWRNKYFMSREERHAAVRVENEPVRGGGSTGSPDPVLPHLNQAEPTEPAKPEPEREPVILHNLSRSALIALLSVQKNDNGGWRFSKNQIAAFVGGTKADVLKEIDLYRPMKPTVEKPSPRIERPVNGWGS